jgi:hypothetical protein
MKKIIIIISSVSIATVLSGCALLTKTPVVNSTGQTNIVYSVPQGFVNVSNQIESAIPYVSGIIAATPAAPAAPLIPSATNVVLAGVSGLLGLLAAYKNNQSNQHQAAAASLAATVVATGQTQTAMNNAAANGSTAAVAVHLANAVNPVQL